VALIMGEDKKIRYIESMGNSQWVEPIFDKDSKYPKYTIYTPPNSNNFELGQLMEELRNSPKRTRSYTQKGQGKVSRSLTS
jgi:hypothetical protein